MRDRLEELEEILHSLGKEIQSLHDSSVESALFSILEELRFLRSKLGKPMTPTEPSAEGSKR